MLDVPDVEFIRPCGFVVLFCLIFDVLAFCVSFVSCIVMMSGWVLCIMFLVPQFCF